MSRHGGRRGQITDFRDSFETINWLYLLFKCGIKTKTHFEWLLWHWSSLGQLNLEPTRPYSLVGCKVPTDLVKISVKEAKHMGFYYIDKAANNVGLICKKYFLEILRKENSTETCEEYDNTAQEVNGGNRKKAHLTRNWMFLTLVIMIKLLITSGNNKPRDAVQSWY